MLELLGWVVGDRGLPYLRRHGIDSEWMAVGGEMGLSKQREAALAKASEISPCQMTLPGAAPRPCYLLDDPPYTCGGCVTAQIIADALQRERDEALAKFVRALGLKDATRECPNCIGIEGHHFAGKDCSRCQRTGTIPLTLAEVVDAGVARRDQEWREWLNAEDADPSKERPEGARLAWMMPPQKAKPFVIDFDDD